MKKILEIIKLYLLSKDIWEAKMEEPILPRRPSSLEMETLKTYILKPGDKPAEEQLKEVEEARKHPIVFDEDCKELSPTMIKVFKSATINRNRRGDEKYESKFEHIR